MKLKRGKEYTKRKREALVGVLGAVQSAIWTPLLTAVFTASLFVLSVCVVILCHQLPDRVYVLYVPTWLGYLLVIPFLLALLLVRMLSSAKSVSAAIGVPALIIVLSHVKSWPLSYTLRSWWLLRSLVKEANERGLEPEGKKYSTSRGISLYTSISADLGYMSSVIHSGIAEASMLIWWHWLQSTHGKHIRYLDSMFI